jgi:hypothetical protein
MRSIALHSAGSVKKMILSGILERIAGKSPIPVMVRASMEFALRDEDLDKVFSHNAEKQYTRTLLFSTLVSLMVLAVSRVRTSVRAAYVAMTGTVDVSLQAIYDKLNNMETPISQGLLRHVSSRLSAVIEQMEGGCNDELLPGYRVKLLDGNHLAATEHRIEALRQLGGGPLPGFALVVFDPKLGLAVDVFLEEDGHAQERSLTEQFLASVAERDLIVDDRNFCTSRLLFGISERSGFFCTRQHRTNVRWKSLGARRECGATQTGKVFEEPVILFDSKEKTIGSRRIILQLNKKTRDGDREISILSNLPEDVTAVKISELYRERWTIEGVFQELERALDGEIDTLGYPKAALFSFCLALCAYNVYATTKAALRAVHGEKVVREQVSDYRIATEITAVYGGIEMATEPEDWEKFQKMDTIEFSNWMVDAARKVNIDCIRKARRGIKKPQPKRIYDSAHPHVSTARILAVRNAKNKRK